MHVHSPAESGRSLDRQIARLIDGERSIAEPPPYSTEDAASDDLVGRLRRHGIDAELEQESEDWYCVFWASQLGDGVRERVATGSAPRRALAICRAVLNLHLSGTGHRLRLRTASRGWIAGDESPRLVADEPRAHAGAQKGTPSGGEEPLEPTRAVQES